MDVLVQLSNKISHAYLISTTDNDKKIIIDLIKKIICPRDFKVNCNDCNICKRIDNNNYPEFIALNETKNIKKENIINLKNYFQNTKLEGKKRVYLINNIEDVNSTVSNSILKFLEEPEKDIVAIITTKNVNKVLETIRSRCQTIYLDKKDDIYSRLIIDELCEEELLEKKEIVQNIAIKYENVKNEILIYLKKILHDNIKNKDKNEYQDILELLIILYEESLDYYLTKKTKYDFFDLEVIKKINNYNNPKKLLSKIDKMLEIKNYLNYNVNSLLIFDKMFIEMSEIDEMYKS